MRPSLTKPIHICFDSHVHGILEGWYSILEKTRENVTILALRDNLAIGPLKPENPALRKAALQETGTEEVADSFCDDYRAFLQALTTLPPDRPCCVWASDSPHERIGVALAGAYLAPQRDTFFLCDSAALVRHQVRLFEYQPDRSGKRPEAFLKGFTGALVTDGYQGYNLLTKVTHCGCWAHARRKWREAMPEGATVKTSSKCSITTRVQIRQAPDWEPA